MNPGSIQERKSAIRACIREALKRISKEEAAAASAGACSILRNQPEWRGAGAILFYYPIAGEVSLMPLMREALAAGRLVALPRLERETGVYSAARVENLRTGLISGGFGIMEPPPSAPAVPLKQLDLILVPGIAFDHGGARLGRGNGFYDRLLSGAHGIRCGVAHDLQIVDELPVEAHDVVMSCILTATRWLSISRARS